jgi:hypothetical protein
MNVSDQENGSSDGSLTASPQVVAALESYHDALRAGRAIDRAAFLIQHADIADQLRDCLAAIEMIESVSGALSVVGDVSATLGHVRPIVIVEFEATNKMLADGRDAAAAPVANRLTRWLKEHQ